MKGILFSTPMVQAILDGRKTVTRRKIDRDITNFCDVDTDGTLLDYQNCDGDFINPVDLCRYKKGDILYVREAYADLLFHYVYKADYRGQDLTLEELDLLSDVKWKPSIFMPKRAARIFLKVTDVRVERVQDVTEEQAIKEGIGSLFLDYIAYSGDLKYSVPMEHETLAIEQFELLWDSINLKRGYGWEANPWVWVIEFERVEVANE